MVLILIGLFVVFFLLVFLDNVESSVCFGDECFVVEIADSVEERARGLMFREAESLSENEGMLFIFPEEGVYSFWMKNTLISLDIIWVDSNGEVVFVFENAQPCSDSAECLSIVPQENALYVLEVNAGSINRIGVKVGDVIEMRI